VWWGSPELLSALAWGGMLPSPRPSDAQGADRDAVFLAMGLARSSARFRQTLRRLSSQALQEGGFAAAGIGERNDCNECPACNYIRHQRGQSNAGDPGQRSSDPRRLRWHGRGEGARGTAARHVIAAAGREEQQVGRCVAAEDPETYSGYPDVLRVPNLAVCPKKIHAPAFNFHVTMRCDKSITNRALLGC